MKKLFGTQILNVTHVFSLMKVFVANTLEPMCA